MIYTNNFKKRFLLLLGGFIIVATFLFCTSSPVYATEIEYIESVPMEEADGVMLLIEYEANNPVYTDDGLTYYVPSAILDNYKYVCVNSNKNVAYFYNEFYFNVNAGNLLIIGASSSSDDSFEGLLSIDLTDVGLGDFVTATTYDNSISMGNSTRAKCDFNHDINVSGTNVPASLTVGDISGNYNVTFVTGYDDIVVESVVTDEKGLLASIPTPTTAPTGLKFSGWYLDEELNTEVTSSYVFYKDTTLYAKWVDVGSVDSEQLDTIQGLLTYIVGIMIFFVIIILCRYIYAFLNMFFRF